MAKPKTETLIIRVPADMKSRLQKLADADQRTLSDFIRLQIEKIVTPVTKS